LEIPVKSLLNSRMAHRWAQRFTKHKMASFGRTIAPALAYLTIATAAHAQGTIDFSGANGVMTSFKTFALFAGAIICFGGLIFAGIRMMSGRFRIRFPVFSALCSALASLAGAQAGLVHSPGRPSPNPCP